MRSSEASSLVLDAVAGDDPVSPVPSRLTKPGPLAQVRVVSIRLAPVAT